MHANFWCIINDCFFLWKHIVGFLCSKSEQPKCYWTTLVCIVILLHSLTFDRHHYKIVDHFEVRHFFLLLLSKIASSTTNWTKKGTIIWETNEGMGFLYPHHLEQWWMSISCKQDILLICYILVYDYLNWEKMPPHFWAKTKLKTLDGFLIQFEMNGGC
jgi:hypothetical protein